MDPAIVSVLSVEVGVAVPANLCEITVNGAELLAQCLTVDSVTTFEYEVSTMYYYRTVLLW